MVVALRALYDDFAHLFAHGRCNPLPDLGALGAVANRSPGPVFAYRFQVVDFEYFFSAIPTELEVLRGELFLLRETLVTQSSFPPLFRGLIRIGDLIPAVSAIQDRQDHGSQFVSQLASCQVPLASLGTRPIALFGLVGGSFQLLRADGVDGVRERPDAGIQSVVAHGILLDSEIGIFNISNFKVVCQGAILEN